MENIKAQPIYDLLGVGFGPSNLALAIALEADKQLYRKANILFLEKQSDYRWHGNTVTDQSELQISFLKDLVSLRDPTSPYSFVNYLHKHDRLVDFINLGTFYPSRLEFNDYLRWVSSHFTEQCSYGEDVLSCEPIVKKGKVNTVRVLSRNARGEDIIRESRSLVVGAGGAPRIPDVFKPLRNDTRIFHHSSYLQAMSKQPCPADKAFRIAVIGAGQSAVEAFIDLNDNYPTAHVDMVVRSFSLKPADSSPFVNEIFAPQTTDRVYQQSQNERDQFLQEHRYANYSAVDMPMLEQMYSIFYRQKVSGQVRHTFRGSSAVEQVSSTKDGVSLVLKNGATGERSEHQYDIVILATGYERNKHRELLAPLAEYLTDYQTDRDYKVKADARFHVPVYLQGYCESSHGISDTLLSVLGVRAGEISHSLLRSLKEQDDQINASNKAANLRAIESL